MFFRSVITYHTASAASILTLVLFFAACSETDRPGDYDAAVQELEGTGSYLLFDVSEALPGRIWGRQGHVAQVHLHSHQIESVPDPDKDYIWRMFFSVRDSTSGTEVWNTGATHAFDTSCVQCNIWDWTVGWDGRDFSGNPVPAGVYEYSATVVLETRELMGRTFQMIRHDSVILGYQGIVVEPDSWAIVLRPGYNATETAQSLALVNVGPIGALDDYYLLERGPNQHEDVGWITQQLELSPAVARVYYQEPSDLELKQIVDPEFEQQWHLENTVGTTDANVVPAWSQVTGQGVRVAVVDNGIAGCELDASGGCAGTHPDLAPNYAPQGSYNMMNVGSVRDRLN